MIRLTHAIKLAYTKIRTRKIRLFVTVFVASLLFAGLAAGSLLFSGVTRSLESFSDEGFTKRYIISGSFTDTSMMNKGPETAENIADVSRAEALEKVDTANKKAAAARLGIEYTPNENEKAVIASLDGSKSLNTYTPIGQQVIAEREAAMTHHADQAAFQRQLGEGAAAIYQARKIAMQGMLYNQSKLTPLVDGREKYTATNQQAFAPPGYTQGIDGITDSWTLMDDQLITPFLLPGQTLEKGNDGSIPIIVSYSAAQEILKLPVLDRTATLPQKKQRLITVRKDVASKTFEVCYRNAAAYQQLQMAIDQQTDLKQNGNKKEYQKPELLYGLPASPCTAPTVQRDVRSWDTKSYDKKVQQFNQQFGAQQPAMELLRFRVVGISPDKEVSMGAPSVEDMLSMMTMSSLGSSWVSPRSFETSSPALTDVFRIAQGAAYEPQQYYLAEYTASKTARAVLAHRNCVVQYPGVLLEPGQVACSASDRPFALQSFGSASLALEDVKAGFRKTQLIAAGVVAVLASITLMGMIGRIIADARKETAVFRAVGASRLAIAQIYSTYTLYLVVLIVIVAFIIGFAVALYVHNQYSPSTSIQMALLFNVADLGKQFYYYAIDWYDVGLITSVVAVAALVGAAVPIAHNIQRNPIRDMRED